MKSWTLSGRVTALSLATALILGVIAAVAAGIALGNRSEVDRMINRDTPLALSAQTLLTALVNQETGIRGYALNGRPGDLETYDQGARDEASSEDQLIKLLDDHPALADQVRDIRATMTRWRAEVATPVIQAVRGGDRAAAQAEIGDAARHRFDSIRASVGQLQNALAQLRAERVQAVKDGATRLVALLVVAGLVIVFAALLLAVLLRYLVTGPVTRLAGEVRTVAAGDYEHVVTVEGPPEVGRLARDVERMRRRIVQDLQEVRGTRLQLETQADELTRSNRDLEQFAYVASHDLQEPLRKVASFCQMLQRRYGDQLDERGRQYIEFAVDAAKRMQVLINDLLTFSQVGRLIDRTVPVDLEDSLAQALGNLSTRLEENDAEVEHDPLPTVLGDPTLLTMLLQNLVANAVKFRSADRPPRIRVSAERVSAEGGRAEWRLAVQDNGIGLDPQFADKIFVIFQRLHAREEYGGTGIGLALAKKIVEYHGGRIWLDPDYREGARFCFTLPVVAVDGAATDLEPTPQGASAS